MPRSTFAYWFEQKVCGVAQQLAARFGGERGPDQWWLFLLNADGSMEPADDEFSRSSEFRNKLVQQGQAYLFFDPFDAPEYTYLEWHGIDRVTMERLMGEPFEDRDFVHVRELNSEHASRISYPQSWDVMF